MPAGFPTTKQRAPYGWYRGKGDTVLTPKGKPLKKQPVANPKAAAGSASPTFQSIMSRFYQGWLTPAQQRAQARKDTNLAISDSLRDLRSTYQAETERQLRQQYAQGNAAGLLQNYGAAGSAQAQAIRDAYGSAAGKIQATDRGFIAPAIAAQAQNAAQGQEVAANLAGYDGPAIAPGSGANGDVLNYLSTLPTGTLVAQGEAGATHAGKISADTAAEFANQAVATGATLRDLSDKYTMAVRDIEGKRGGMLNEALGNYRSGDAQNMSAMMSALSLQSTMGNNAVGNSIDSIKAKADLLAAQGKNKREQEKIRAAALKAQGLAPDGKTLLPEYYKAADGTIRKIPYGSIVGPKGTLIKDPNNPAVAGGGKGGSGKAPTATQMGTMRKSMTDAARTRLGLDMPAGFGKIPNWSKAQILKFVLAQYGNDYLTQFPGYKQQIMAAANQVTNTIYNQIQERRKPKR